MNRNVRPNISYFALYVVVAGAGLVILSQFLTNDANFVLYRFAAHLASGRGLTYGTPDTTISTSPLVPLLLSPFATISLPVGTWLLCTFSIAIGAFFLDRLTYSRLIAGLAYVLACLIFPSPVMLIMLALVLAGLDATRRQNWLVSGVLMGLAILAEPSALIPAALLILLTLSSARALWRYLIPAALIPTAGFAVARLSLGDTTFVSIVPQIITAALPIAALIALFRDRAILRHKPMIAILVTWSALAACLALLRGTWPSAAIVPGVIALASTLPIRGAVVAAAALDLILNLVLPNPSATMPGSQALGQWIATHTSADATVATKDIGALGYYADRSLIDLSRRLQDNPFDNNFFLRSAPDVIVLKDNTPVAWSSFKTTYAKAFASDGQTVYQRVVNFTPLTAQPVNIGFSATPIRDDLRLIMIGITSTAHPGDLVRVRLDWQLNFSSSFDKSIKVTLVDAEGKTAVTAEDTIPAVAWTVGVNTTYHLLVLSRNLPTGQYAVNVELTLNNGNLGPHQVTELDVAK